MGKVFWGSGMRAWPREPGLGKTKDGHWCNGQPPGKKLPPPTT